MKRFDVEGGPIPHMGKQPRDPPSPAHRLLKIKQAPKNQ